MKEIKIQIPEGYEGIDEEKSSLAEGRIVFKKKEPTPWRNNKKALLSGYYVTDEANIENVEDLFNVSNAWNVFATKKQAQSMLAMAQLSQIIQNDQRFGGPITDEEWLGRSMYKYIIDRHDNDIKTYNWIDCNFRLLAFHTEEQRDLFLRENEDLIRQYLMLD
jgi:hypothetical protein